MTKSGSNAYEQRIRAHAAEAGLSYREAARAIDHASRADRTVLDHIQSHVQVWRGFQLRPEALAEEREYYLWHL
ncbi:hypothetical protein ACWFQ8_24365 [Streptomyces sp. NPDC055254]